MISGRLLNANATSAVIGAVLGASLTIITDTVYTAPRQLKYEATNAYLAQYNDAFLSEKKLQISLFLLRPKIQPIFSQSTSPREINLLIWKELREDTDVSLSLIFLADFFRQIYICIEANRCEADYAHEILASDARSLSRVFSYSLRQIEKEYGYAKLGNYVDLFIDLE